MDIYDAFARNTDAVSQISRSDNGRLEEIEFNSKSATVEHEGETYEASEIISQLRNGSQFDEPNFHYFVRNGGPDSSDGASTGLITAGYITGFLLPIVGIILGIVVMVKGSGGQGGGIIGFSIFSWILWAALLF